MLKRIRGAEDLRVLYLDPFHGVGNSCPDTSQGQKLIAHGANSL